MSVWNDKTIANWTPTQLAKFVQETIASDPPPLPPQITLDSLSVIGDTEIGGNVQIAGLTEILGLTNIQLPTIIARDDNGQTVSNATYETLNLNTVVFDNTQDEINLNLGSNEIEVRSAGIYLIGCSMGWAGNGTGYREVKIEDQFARSYGRSIVDAVPGTKVTAHVAITVSSIPRKRNIKFQVRQTSGGNLNTTSSLNELAFMVRLAKTSEAS